MELYARSNDSSYVANEFKDAVLATQIDHHVRDCQQRADRVLALEHFLKLMRSGLLTSRIRRPLKDQPMDLQIAPVPL